MALAHIQVESVRNLKTVSLKVNPQLNVFIGRNGSGKSAILEAVHLLSLGRSYRNHSVRSVINHDAKQLTIHGKLTKDLGSVALGIQKQLDGITNIRINGINQSSIIELAEALPVVILEHDSLRLLDVGSQSRRRFIDWGTFHLKPSPSSQSFYTLWQRFNRTLKQRNAALRKKDITQLKTWTPSFIELSKQLTTQRQNYLKHLQENLTNYTETFFPNLNCQLDYEFGWKKGAQLEEMVYTHQPKDLQYGYTTIGPHRADLKISVNEKLAKDYLSRGQKKMLVCALRLAQISLLQKQQPHKKCVVLLDDIEAELDTEHQQKLMTSLLNLKTQLWVTSTEQARLTKSLEHTQGNLFNVSNGIISTQQY